ncbi:hypothetical protein LTR86_010208 [Recurvomyces mirabilis]|nr:hypothetical protein LTR86_010208 [Recurvomyces mirabilis]
MRLLHTTTLQFAEYYDQDTPAYAILSHRWLDGQEVSYIDYCLCVDQARYGEKLPEYLCDKANTIRSRSGFTKILDFCKVAWLAGLAWVWIDTCCIDKSSSAELTEAINSMWNWYERSALCIVYFNDVETDASYAGISSSAWFTRGWTLQELLAPSRLNFFDRDWIPLYQLDKATFKAKKRTAAMYYLMDDPDWAEFGHMLAQASHVPAPFVCGYQSLHSASAAMKLSWASFRRTSRVEDRAYSLLGLLGINMPLLYGEGQQAFIRLQKEFIQTYDDESILAWCSTCPSPNLSSHCFSGVLATNLECFQASGDIVTIMQYGKPPWQTINQLLQVEAAVYVQSANGASTTTLLLPLACKHCDERGRLHLELTASSSTGAGVGHYMRVSACKLISAGMQRQATDDRRLLLHLNER